MNPFQPQATHEVEAPTRLSRPGATRVDLLFIVQPTRRYMHDLFAGTHAIKA
jgi:hypothetical protein